ncbi:MAG: hypothetical protein V3U88_12725 [Methylococcales bacterium]
MAKKRSAYLEAIQFDNSIPIEPKAIGLWLKDLDNPMRWSIRPILQFVFAALLHLIWFFKRLPLPQFRAHGLLQKLICWFCTHFVSHETNFLILRHFAAESNVLNFLAANSGKTTMPEPVKLYPKTIDAMIEHSFVDHDQELFRIFKELKYWDERNQPMDAESIDWQYWQPINMEDFAVNKKMTQILDFENSHVMFMCLFCILLTRDEYRDAINGFNLDQSIAIRIGQIIGDQQLAEMAYNKYPHYLVGPWNLSQRFLMHGFFMEYLYAKLDKIRQETEY